MSLRIGLLGTIATAVILAACAPSSELQNDGDDGQEPEFDIITLLPKDAIRSIDKPQFYSVAEADAEYEADEVVMGVEFSGDARAYPVGLLSSHEIVNDTVGGRPIAVTW